MAYQGIGTGTSPNDNNGDSLLTGAVKINSNFKEIYNALGDGNSLIGGFIPIGGIIMWSGSIASVPTGWSLCNGSNGTPDLRDRFIVGAGSAYVPGNTGGANSVTLSESQIPAHSHSGSTASAGDHSHSGSTSSAGSHSHTGSTDTQGNHTHLLGRFSGDSNINTQSSRYALATTNNIGPDSTQAAGSHSHNISTNSAGDHSHTVSIASAGSHTHSVTVGNTGGGQAHENRPPYYALAFIMRTA